MAETWPKAKVRLAVSPRWARVDRADGIYLVVLQIVGADLVPIDLE